MCNGKKDNKYVAAGLSFLIMMIVIIGATLPLEARLAREAESDLSSFTLSKPNVACGIPSSQFCGHTVGRLWLMVSNSGIFGNQNDRNLRDCITNRPFSAEYPRGSGTEYLFQGSLWVGAIVGNDTLVSTGHDGWLNVSEMFADVAPQGDIVAKSFDPSFTNYSGRNLYDPNDPTVKSTLDLIAVYSDTNTCPYVRSDQYSNRPHKPINVLVKQHSYQWNYRYAEDFVLFDYQLVNIGSSPIEKLWMGIYIDADVWPARMPTGYKDDICGFRKWAIDPSTGDSVFIGVAWIADDDGDGYPAGGGPDAKFDETRGNTKAVTGTRVIRTPNPDLQYSFNWWVSEGNDPPRLDFGPQQVWHARPNYSAGWGTPEGDILKYVWMSNGEFDYDQVETALQHPRTATDSAWIYPADPAVAVDLANGYDTRYLLSFGPFDIDSGGTLPLTIAYLAGDNFHRTPQDWRKSFPDNAAFTTPERVRAFTDSVLDYSDLAINALWAAKVYDNPICVKVKRGTGEVDSCWTDGIPDFKGPPPPLAPQISLQADIGKLVARWNGKAAELGTDPFSGKQDFEGYRIYMSRGSQASDFILLGSYDKIDFQVWYRNVVASPPRWERLKEPPMLLADVMNSFKISDPDSIIYVIVDSLHAIRVKRDSSFTKDTLFYFVPEDMNLGFSAIRVYPDTAAVRSAFPDWTDAKVQQMFEDSLKYEYIFPVDNLIPSRPVYIGVTTFDYGDAETGLDPLETSPVANAQLAFPLNTTDRVLAENMPVAVFPNPYKIDAGYQVFESSTPGVHTEYDRRVHFINLPPKCTIRIYTLDGDLVREIRHDRPITDPLSSYDFWDLISRNTQAIVTGLYIYTVEAEELAKDSPLRKQVGKIVIMK